MTLLIPVFIIIAVCILIMAVGAIFRGKTFSSCACGSITFKGEKIDCPGHVDNGGDGETVPKQGCCKNS